MSRQKLSFTDKELSVITKMYCIATSGAGDGDYESWTAADWQALDRLQDKINGRGEVESNTEPLRRTLTEWRELLIAADSTLSLLVHRAPVSCPWDRIGGPSFLEETRQLYVRIRAAYESFDQAAVVSPKEQ